MPKTYHWMFLTPIIGIAIFALTGCSRTYYRQQADCDVNHLLNAAPKDKRWELTDYSIQADTKSRFYDSFNPDCEPMPPDDPKAHKFMHSVYGMDTAEWDAKGRTPYIENPYWKQYLTINEQGEMVLDRQGAFQLAQLHSPDFQTALENLYISALDVSFQRFRFDTQFDSIHSLFYNVAGDSSNWSATNGLDMTKLSATGGEYMIGIANSLTWTLSGSEPSGPGTVISMSILQPLLRGGGRAVVLESLTQAERNLLSNIRQMAFYRQGFYNNVIVGGQNVGTPVAVGAPSGQSIGAGSVGGYLSLILQQIRITNQQANVVSQKDSLEQLLANFQAGRLKTRLQVEQAKKDYLDSISTLLERETSYDTSVDQFLTNVVGLPPDTNVRMEDHLLDQFQLMSPNIEALQEELASFLREIRDDENPVPDDAIDTLIQILARVNNEIPGIKRDIEKLDQSVSERVQNLKFLQERLTQLGRGGDMEAFSVEELIKRVERVHYWMPIYEKNLTVINELLPIIKKQERQSLVEMLHQGTIDVESLPLLKHLELHTLLDETVLELEEGETAKHKAPEHSAQRDPYRAYLIRVTNRLFQEVRFIAVNQSRARLDTITMLPVDLKPETSLKIAAENRLDWMNERTKLVNSWRNIEVVANQLRGFLNLKFDGEIGTPHDKPFDFQSSRSSLTVGAEFEAPLTRLEERNRYRVALIEYQRSRRSYYTYVDEVNASMRQLLRRIETIQIDFEFRRESVNAAISQVMLAQMEMEQPQAVGDISNTMSDNLARNVTDALNSLLDTQNSLMALWADHYTLRMALCLDLGLMQLDEQGMWIDPGSMRELDYIRFANTTGVSNTNTPTGNNVFPVELTNPSVVDAVEANIKSSENSSINSALSNSLPPPPRIDKTPLPSSKAVPDFREPLKKNGESKVSPKEMPSAPIEKEATPKEEIPSPLTLRRAHPRIGEAPLPPLILVRQVEQSVEESKMTQTSLALSPSGKANGRPLVYKRQERDFTGHATTSIRQDTQNESGDWYDLP